MLMTTTKRIIRSALTNFWRNRVLSLSSVLVMTVTLFVFGGLMFSNFALDSVLTQIKDKVDINVYFVTTASEDDILDLKNSLELLPEVGSIEYISRDQALQDFKDRHQDDQLTLQALNELDDNPLGAVFNIHAKQTSQYESIAKFLESDSALSKDGANIIDKVNYYQNKLVIDRLNKIIDGTENIGFAVTLILIILSIIVTLNTIRLTIYTSREEISVMRLVGASNKFIQGPFLIEGILYGFVASVITLIAFLPITYYLGDFTQRLFSANMFDYYLNNFFTVFLVIMVSGILLGVVSSYLAVRKYLKK